MNNVLLSNIRTHSYFREVLSQLRTFDQVVDQIYYDVKYCTPWEQAGQGARKVQSFQ